MFVLSGEELTLPFAETRALIETYSNAETTATPNSRVVISSLRDTALIERIAERGAYCRFGGLVAGRSIKIESIIKNLDLPKSFSQQKFAVRSNSVDRSICGELGQALKSKTGALVDLENPEWLFHIEQLGPEYVVAYSRRGYKEFSWKARRPRARRFFLPSAIYPKLARVLVNLSRVKEGEIFLDPFCGTASLLIESSLMGMESIGIDLKRWIARGGLLNLKEFRLEFDSIMRADSSSKPLPLNRVDAISTDVPYGRASSTLGKTTGQILNGFLDSIADVLPQQRHCVVMHPDSISAEGNSKFDKVEEHFLYVHRSLTRAITVLRRK
jgi:tRNA (guanine10-N2)-dimethyltransferase